MELWQFILILVVAFQLISSIYVLLQMRHGIGAALLPNEIYDSNDITWFGAITLFILELILIPFVYLCGLLKLIFVGRWFEQ